MTDTDLVDFYIRAFNAWINESRVGHGAVFGGAYIGVFDLRRPLTRETLAEQVAQHIAWKAKERLTK